MIEEIKKISKQEKAIFVKFEPNFVYKTFDSLGNETLVNQKLQAIMQIHFRHATINIEKEQIH